MMGSWSIILAICGLICIGLGVGGRLTAQASGWLFLMACFFLVLAVTLHVSSLLLKDHRRRR